jgi:hypothetical protein
MKAAPNKAQSLKTAHNLIHQHNCGKVSYTSDLSTYQKRARAKFSQNNLLRHLAKLNSPLKHQYVESQFCSFTLMQSGHTFTAKYCKQRFCKICNRIRTSKLMQGYDKAIKAMIQPQFVTLTIENVPGEKLRETIKTMLSDIRKIQDLRRKNKQKLIKGIRKLECTYNPDRDDYHPHFHFIIESKEQAEELKKAWLERNNTALEYLQNIKDAENPIELFKYFAKLTSKRGDDIKIIKGKKVIREEWHYPVALDLIFVSIQNIRIIQPMGGIKMVSDEIEEIESVENVESENDETVWMWKKVGTNKERYTYDWVNIFTGELLTGYEPTEKEYNYQKRIRYLQT